MKRQITIIITALILSASLILSGCAENTVGGENNGTGTESNVTEAMETTPSVTVTAEAAEPVTSAAETSAVTGSESIKETPAITEKEKETEAPVSVTAASTAPVAAWAETAASGTMYINTNGIYSRKEAVQGSAKVKQYGLNEAVTVTAKTNTGYYKLSGGAFIHMDYLSANKVTVTTTTTVKPVVTTTSIQSKPSEDRSYLNLSNSDVQYILNECQKYAKSLGYRVVTYNEYERELSAVQEKTNQLSKEGAPWEKIQAVLDEFNADLKYIINCNDQNFWNSDWHNIMYAGNFTSDGSHDGNGYDLHCSTKQESIDWIIIYLKKWIKHEAGNGRSCSTIGSKLKTFDEINKAKDGWHLTYEDFQWEYSSYHKFDMNTSYAFSVKFY